MKIWCNEPILANAKSIHEYTNFATPLLLALSCYNHFLKFIIFLKMIQSFFFSLYEFFFSLIYFSIIVMLNKKLLDIDCALGLIGFT